jgi:sulfur-carrier protein
VTVQLHLRYFASLREALGRASESWSSEAQTVGQLRDELIARGEPYASALRRERLLRASINQVVCDEAVALMEGGEVAFFPPVTGG